MKGEDAGVGHSTLLNIELVFFRNKESLVRARVYVCVVLCDVVLCVRACVVLYC